MGMCIVAIILIQSWLHDGIISQSLSITAASALVACWLWHVVVCTTLLLAVLFCSIGRNQIIRDRTCGEVYSQFWRLPMMEIHRLRNCRFQSISIMLYSTIPLCLSWIYGCGIHHKFTNRLQENHIAAVQVPGCGLMPKTEAKLERNDRDLRNKLIWSGVTKKMCDNRVPDAAFGIYDAVCMDLFQKRQSHRSPQRVKVSHRIKLISSARVSAVSSLRFLQ